MTASGVGTITGWAGDVPFTALPPGGDPSAAGPLVVTWHMMDAPSSDAAFAVALPLTGVPAWRVHLGMPLVGRRPVEGAYETALSDPMLRYVAPVVDQVTGELPAVLDELRDRFPLTAGPIGVVGGSLGGMVALNVLARQPVPIAAAALVNPGIRARSVVSIFTESAGTKYEWGDDSNAAADRLDFVANAGLIAERAPQPAVLVVSGELDYPVSRVDAHELVESLRAAYVDGDRVQMTTIPGLDHPIADRDEAEPAKQIPLAKLVDDAVTGWFRRYLS